MIENRLKKCCLNCRYPDIEKQEYSQYCAYDGFPTKETKIFCKHEPVCKAYYEETEATANENASTDKQLPF